MSLIVLTGASGSGKTAIADAIEAASVGVIDVYHFDRIGVPSLGEMVAEFGSPEAWQRAKTREWWGRVTAAASARAVLFEGQMRLSFLAEAAATSGSISHKLVLVDCDDATRAKRLTFDRGQPDLANDEMMNWASFLRREAVAFDCDVLDTSRMTIAESAAAVRALFPEEMPRQ